MSSAQQHDWLEFGRFQGYVLRHCRRCSWVDQEPNGPNPPCMPFPPLPPLPQ